MKIRSGFVSNSSSTSFICEVCGEDVSGWDMSHSEAKMYTCENGHTFCEIHADISDEDLDRKLRAQAEKEMKDSGNDGADVRDWIEDIKSEMRSELPKEFCPICTMKVFLDSDLINYMYTNYADLMGMSKDTVRKWFQNLIREGFKSYEEFKEYIK